jgi:IclR family mhp operon transcriptional activator
LLPDHELKSLSHGLEALRIINTRPMISISELAREMGIPRSNAERIMMTLAIQGYVARVPGDRRFRLCEKVRSLSAGFVGQDRLVEVAAPLMFELTKQIGWPLGIAVPHADKMALALATDSATSLWLRRRNIGSEIPIARSSSGVVYLSFTSDAERASILAMLASEPQPPGGGWLDDEVFSQEVFAAARRDGYAFVPVRGSNPESSVSVPILDDGALVGCLFMAFMVKGLSESEVVRKFVPLLKALAGAIGARFTERALGGPWPA